MAKFCPMCGTNVPDSAMNCPMCGGVVNSNQYQQQMTGQPMNQQPMNQQPMMGQPQMYNQQQMMGQPQMPGYTLPSDKNATASLICGLIGFLLCTYVAIPGLICGCMSLNNIKEGKVSPKSKGLAITGIVFSCLGICLMIYNIINYVS